MQCNAGASTRSGFTFNTPTCNELGRKSIVAAYWCLQHSTEVVQQSSLSAALLWGEVKWRFKAALTPAAAAAAAAH